MPVYPLLLSVSSLILIGAGGEGGRKTNDSPPSNFFDEIVARDLKGLRVLLLYRLSA
jgi:hypothetical protein